MQVGQKCCFKKLQFFGAILSSVIVAFYHIFFDEFPSTDHRGGNPAAFNIIMIKHKIHVHHGKNDEGPHQDMMDLPYIHIAPEKRNHPCKHFRQECIAHGSIHAEAGKALQQEDEKCDEIDETCQGIMADRINFFICDLKNVNFDHIHHFFPLAALERDVIVPPRKFIPCKTPIETKYEVEEKQECTDKMDEPDSTEPIIKIGFSTFHKGRGIAYNIAGDT